MPLFDYRCPSCWTTQEVLVPSSAVTHVVCRTCGRLAEKQPAAPAFTIKGFSAQNRYTGPTHE